MVAYANIWERLYSCEHDEHNILAIKSLTVIRSRPAMMKGARPRQMTGRLWGGGIHAQACARKISRVQDE